MSRNHEKAVDSLKKQSYSVIAVVCVIYCSAAAGAFGVEEMIQGCGPGMTLIVLIGIALVWALPDCFRIAEMSSVMPGEGGYYYWAKQILGEFWGFQMGWWAAVSFYVCSSTYIVLAVNYISTLLPLNNAQATIIKVAIVVIFTAVNLLGLKEVSVMSTIFSIAILVAFAVVTIVGFANWNYNPVEPLVPEGMGFMESLGMGIGIGVWMYCGWGIITMVAGEVKNSQVIPKALRIVVPLTALSYILPSIAGLAAIGHWDSWTTIGAEGVGFSTVLTKFAGPAAAAVFVVIAVIGQLAMFNTNMAGGSRTLFVLADDNLFPKKGITYVSKKRGVPTVGILTIAAVTILMMQMSFQTLILIQVIPILAVAVLMSIIIVKARKVMPKEERIGCYVVGGGKLGLFAVVTGPAVIGVLAFFLNGMDYFLYGLLFLLSGIVLYIIFKLIYDGFHKTEPDKYPRNEKTRLAKGDLFRLGDMFMIIGGTAFAGSFIFKWLEGSWGPEYYASEYGSGLLSSFYGMIQALMIGGIVCIVIAVIFWLIGRAKDKRTVMPAYVDMPKHDEHDSE
ncbi:MAG: APC family permease [Eubacteriaceae bacterium]|nr:APC family permease [Eubacteriaceae bacterium]